MNKDKQSQELAYVEAPACDIISREEFPALNIIAIHQGDSRSWVLEFFPECAAGVEGPHVRYVDYTRSPEPSRDGFWFEATQISLWVNHKAVCVEFDADRPDGSFERVRVDIPPTAFLNMIADVIGDRETLDVIARLLPRKKRGGWLIERLLRRPIANTIDDTAPVVQYSVPAPENSDEI